MRTITAVLAAVGVFGIVATSAPARAHDDDDFGSWRRQQWREHQWREREWRERAEPVYVQPPVVYAQPGYYTPPVYYAPPVEAYYAPPPPPAYYAPSPLYATPGFSIGFSFR